MAINVMDVSEGFDSQQREWDKNREMLHRQILDAISHDLKTPLATIIGSLEIYEQMPDKLTPEKKKVLINTALSEAYRLDNFITNILDMAKLEGGNVKIRPEECNLISIINDCVIRLGPKRNLCKINLAPTTSDIKISIDQLLLSRVLSLVIENAIRHSGKDPVIDIEYGRVDKQCHIQVRDNGFGIPVGKENEIFEKYIRFARTDHQNAGTGLGLPICRKIMSLLSGEITAQNHPHGGAVFSVKFKTA